MADENLELNMRVTLETEEIEKGTKEIEDSIKKMEGTNKSAHQQIQAETEKTGGIWTKVFNLSNVVSLVKNGAGMIIGAIQSIGAVLMDFRDAADDQADAIDGVNLQLKNMGIYTDELSEQLQDHAKALEQLTNYSDQAILEGDKMLLTFENLSGDIMPRATEAMLDMSAVMGTDLKSSAQTIGKALQDPINGLGLLSKQGFAFTEQQKAMIKKFVEQNDIMSAQNIILDELNTAYGGHAKLQVDAIEQAKNAWTSLKEAIGGQVSLFGSKLQPVIDDVFNTFTKIAGAVTKLFPSKAIKEANEYADAAKNQKTEFDLLSITYNRLSANQNKTKEETKVYQDTIAELKKQYPDFLKNIDMEKDGYNGVATALAKINEHLMKKMLFAVKEKEIAKEQQRIIDAESKKYDATLNYNKALSEQQALINELSKKKEKIVTGRYVTTENGFEYAKFTDKDMKNDKEIKYVNGEYVKKMLVAEDEAAARIEREKLRIMKDNFSKEIASYDAEKADATNEIIKINDKYDTIAGVTKDSLEEAEKGKEDDVKGKGTGTSDIKLDSSKTLEQQIQDVKNKAEIEKIAADEYQKQIIDINTNRDIAILTEEMKLKKEIEKIKNDYESTDDANKKKKLQKQLTDAQEATQEIVHSLKYNAATEIKAIQDAKQAEEKYEQEAEDRRIARQRAREQQRENVSQNSPEKRLERGEAYASSVVGMGDIGTNLAESAMRDKKVEELKNYNSLLEQLYAGEFLYKNENMKKLADADRKDLEMKQAKIVTEKQLEKDMHDFKAKLGGTSQELANKLVSGEIKNIKQVKELGKQKLKDFLVNKGQEHAFIAVSEGGLMLKALAAQEYPIAGQHALAMAENAAIAAAFGTAANAIKIPSGNEEKDNNNQNSNLPGSAVSPDNVKKAVIHIDNRETMKIMLPELAQLLEDGYSISEK